MQAQPVTVNFAQGIDQKSDPKQLPLGKFERLVNRVFNKEGLLDKRNGYGQVTKISNSTTISTYQGGLVTIGARQLNAYSPGLGASVNTGYMQPLSLEVMPLVRSASSQTTADVAIASNGLACSTWLDSNGGSYYQITDTADQQIVVPSVQLPSTATCSRVFCLGQYFIVTFLATVSAASHLQYVAVPITNPSTPIAATDIASTASALTAAYDAAVGPSNLLYIAWNKSATIGVASLNTSLQLSAALSISSNTANLMSLTVDSSGVAPVAWITWWNSSGSVIKTTAYDQNLSSTPLLAPTTVVSSITVNEITSVATGNVMTAFYEVANTYSFSPNTKSDYLAKNTCTLAGTAGTAATILRGAGLGSKAVYSSANSLSYMLAAYGQAYQPSYYLIDSSGRILSRFAYSNGGGYAANQILPQMIAGGSNFQVGYLFKDLVQGVNKTQGIANVNGVYSQTGINLASFTLGGNTLSAEIGQSLHMNGGFLWMYDGVKPVEHNFFVWPEDVQIIGSPTSGNMIAQQYFIQMTYEWTDAQGNPHRSAPSVPATFTILTAPGSFTGNRTSGSPTLAAVSSFTNLQVGQPIAGTGIPANTYILALNSGAATLTMSANASSGSATSTTITPTTLTSVNVFCPTLRQTYKTGNAVRIVEYRWSTAQQNYYQSTSVASPTLNDPTTDSVTINDGNSDAQIIGNALIYTTGGVVENIGAPPARAVTLFDDRFWQINSEDGTLQFSKPVLQATPVEMSDLFTYYVAPTIGASGSTGLPKCIFPMDDKMIVFKDNAIYYFNGTGPNIMDAGSQYSEPIFITSTVGCDNPSSIVFTPQGLMFQSQNGIWILRRDLTTDYIGKEVQDFNSYPVTSATAIPGTTRVIFTLGGGALEALVYDYYFGQWGEFSNVNALGSTLYQNLHTYLNPYGQILQETPGKYLDVSAPVLWSLKSGWINLAGIQGYQRLWEFYILGKYLSPHKIQVGIAYDYGPGISETRTIDPNPINFNAVYGSAAIYGDGPYGGTDLEQWRVQQQRQKCQSFQITMQEIYDPSYGVENGAGCSLSGLTMLLAIKRGARPLPARQTTG